MSTPLFRKVSLDRLSSPEQLDVLMKVTSPMGWLSLLSIGMLLVAAVFWGIYGSLATTVMGSGILIKSGGVLDVACLAGGQVTAIYVGAGDNVSRGQVVARVAQPKLLSDITRNRGQLLQMKDEYEKIARFNTEELKAKVEHYAKQRIDCSSSIELSREKSKWLRERMGNQERLLEQGLIRKQEYLNTKREIFDVDESIERAQRDLKQISIDEMGFKQRQRMDLDAKKQQIDRLEAQIAAEEDDFELKSRIVSPYTGAVVEVIAAEGALINGGENLLTMELVGDEINDLEAVVYVPAGDGKKVRPGMKIQISPMTIKREEWGCMLGIVTNVSTFPVTQKGMLRVVANSKLVESFSSGGAMIQIHAALIPDPNSISGFKWSSLRGPPSIIEHGTICAASITVEEQPPISLVIPYFRKHLLGIGI